MITYLINRFFHSLITLLIILTFTFALVRFAPGGPEMMLCGPAFTAQEAAAVRAKLGLDQPLHIQYLKWLRGLLRGDLGRSYKELRPVTAVIRDRLSNTLILSLSAFLLALLISIPLGVFCALKQNQWYDYGITAFSLVGISLPVFWLGILLIIVFAVKLHLLPSAGMATLGQEFSLADRLAHLIMPVTVIVVWRVAPWTRYVRSSMIEVMREDYIRTARAKGLAERSVNFKHALKNALIPVVTIIGLSLPRVVAGSIVTETVFAWPGMGRLAVTAAYYRDYPVIMGLLVVFSTIVVISNLFIDILYTYLDPRVRLK
jgi:peptide/nickel transport system permease protein